MKIDGVKIAGAGAAGFFAATVLVLVLGAQQPAPPVAPRYSVTRGDETIGVTDNMTNTLYEYVDVGGRANRFKLYRKFDLTSAGNKNLSLDDLEDHK